jgi:hypothetical protein
MIKTTSRSWLTRDAGDVPRARRGGDLIDQRHPLIGWSHFEVDECGALNGG